MTNCSTIVLKNRYDQVVAVVEAGAVTFNTGAPLKDSLEASGIVIPDSKQADFHGHKIILINHPLFAKAFIEIYFPACLQESGYTLVKK